ncbi:MULTISPECIES: lipocalin family protein [unclassified Siphonobacter]|uniref:lipocalin family protein n=1 Tax=unclassified Siphonobacter TaxID=2635712 RepID=UPI000CB71627|nr:MULTISPECIES: lipocalin family protein [unclassified Siphonobacter]MDQ1086024.1 hypothetical protein [Siphonobacter sp. SORGH_AS_1065]MDR6196348.1 hypothetical protein [Siphonobacter sp. SORGH_AS_0500]PKK38043.1 hypothetical protein BWI96_02895 [Siphonobacter sp. SORGH_AS_0500]
MDSLLKVIVGTWFICSTNFPMWLKGNKHNPTFTYTPVPEKPGVLLDEVKYQKKGKKKTITGYDYPDEKKPNAFIWRGKGLLGLLKSKWEVRLIDPQGQWAVIYFSKTLFTPEGVDIISRQPQLSPELLQEIKRQMAADSLLRAQVSSLKDL